MSVRESDMSVACIASESHRRFLCCWVGAALRNDRAASRLVSFSPGGVPEVKGAMEGKGKKLRPLGATARLSVSAQTARVRKQTK